MACFLVPTAEAIIVTVAAGIIKTNANKTVMLKNGESKKATEDGTAKVPLYRKLMWLTNFLWGGAFLLAYEHLWHGEVVPWFPFLTAAADPGDAAVMLHEMSTVGVTMALLVTAVWVVMVLVSNAVEKRKSTPEPASTAV